MANRRHFLQAGLTVSASSLTGLSAFIKPAQSAVITDIKPLSLPHFIFDERYINTAEVSTLFSPHNTMLHGVSGDISKLWYEHIDPAWKQEAVAIAGITTESALFYLERLAWIHRLRVVFRGHHAVPKNGQEKHHYEGAESLINNIRHSPEQIWSTSLCKTFMQCEANVVNQNTLNLNIEVPESSDTRPHDTILVSWVLAPISAKTKHS